MTFLDSIRQKSAGANGTCETCGNLVQPAPGLIGCEAHDKLIIPEYPPYHGNAKCPDWKPRTEEKRPMTISELVSRAHENAVKHGFWNLAPEFGTAVALVHSELSEALEEVRADRPPLYYVIETIQADGKVIPEMRTDYGDGAYSAEKPEGVAVELADAVIRIADLCGHLGIDLEAAIALKMAYNETRPFKHGKKF